MIILFLSVTPVTYSSRIVNIKSSVNPIPLYYYHKTKTLLKCLTVKLASWAR